MTQTIAVIGATGVQGGSVARTLLATKQWNIRAITRNTSSEASKSLASAGAEVVTANLDDEASLIRAFAGVDAVFAVTNFWEHLFTGSMPDEAGEKEFAQGLKIARAAAGTQSLKHFIWSTMMPAAEVTGGKFPVPHFDYKAKVDRVIWAEMSDLAAKTTFMMVCWYPSNMAYFTQLKPIPMPDGSKYLWLQPCAPSTIMPVAGDVQVNPGLWTRQILANPEKTKGKYISVQTELLSVKDILKVFSEVTGKPAININVSAEEFEEVWGVAGAELASQLKMQKHVPDWEIFRKADFIKPADIGIGDEAVGLKKALESLKDLL